MSHDERRRSTWWVGRGRTERRWWADGALSVGLAACVVVNVAVDPTRLGWSIAVAYLAASVVLLFEGFA